MYSTIHKSALSQQINKTFFFFFQNCKSIPLYFHLGDWECNGKRQDRAHGPTRGLWAAREGGGREGESYCGGGKGTVTATRKLTLMTNKNARRDNTDHPRHRKVGGMEKLGESGGNFKTLKELGQGAGEEEGGSGRSKSGRRVKSKAKTPKIERHFHMYILQMYIDTIR